MWQVRGDNNLAPCSLSEHSSRNKELGWAGSLGGGRRGRKGARMGEPLQSTKISCLLLPAGGSLGCRGQGEGWGLNGEVAEMLIKKNTLLEGLRPWV